MRVVAGTAKGLLLKAPKGLKTRPTAEKVREAIFSSVSTKIQGASVLDLFAGSGALGIEALSRGAESAIFVDNSFRAIKAIEGNLTHTGLDARGRIIKLPVERLLQKYKGRSFDLIFTDAPYRIGLIKLKGIVDQAFGVLAGGGILIVEHSKKVDLGPDSRITNQKKYGQTLVTFFEKR